MGQEQRASIVGKAVTVTVARPFESMTFWQKTEMQDSRKMIKKLKGTQMYHLCVVIRYQMMK